MLNYSTRQRKALLAYLSRHPDELLSARQIAAALEQEKISLSAVYRNLAQLEAEEKVRRSSKTGTREVYYQYLAAECCKGALHKMRKNLSHDRGSRRTFCKAPGPERGIPAGHSRHDPLRNLLGLQEQE